MVKNISLSASLCAAILLLIFSVSTKAQQQCGCSDVSDMLGRIKEANAAIAAYLAQQKLFEGVKFDNDVYRNKIQPVVQQYINRAHISGTNSAGGSTDTRSCELNQIVTGNPQKMTLTACLVAGVRAHEKQHADNCERWKESEGFDRGNDYRSDMTIAEALGEEMTAYGAEIRFFNEQISQLSQKCKPPNWSGVVKYESIQQTTQTAVVPPDNRGIGLGGSTRFEMLKKYVANFVIVNGQAFVGQSYVLKSTKESESKRVIDCGGGLMNRKTETHTFKSNNTNETSVEGFDKAVSFSVSPDGTDGYTISFRAPAVKGGTARVTSSATETPSCGQAKKPAPALSTPFNLDTETFYTVRAKGKITDENLSGSQTIPMPGGIWTITVSWNLTRGSSANNYADVLPEEVFSDKLLFAGFGNQNLSEIYFINYGASGNHAIPDSLVP
jgi:hypothetical protein